MIIVHYYNKKLGNSIYYTFEDLYGAPPTFVLLIIATFFTYCFDHYKTEY